MVRLLLIAATTYVVICLLVFVARNRLVFVMRGGLTGRPAEFGIADGRAVSIPTSDGQILSGWLLPAAPAPAGAAPLLIWFHCNAETVAALAPLLREFRPPGVAVLAVDYRGYGASTGSPNTANAAHDAWEIWHWLTQQPGVDSTRIVVYGRSIGTGPAVHLASSRPVAGLIIESPFTSLRALARRHYPFFPSFLAPGHFNNLDAIALVQSPILIIHGAQDGIIPADMGRALADRAGARAELWLIAGADHNDTYDSGGDEYVRRFRQFVERAVTSP